MARALAIECLLPLHGFLMEESEHMDFFADQPQVVAESLDAEALQAWCVLLVDDDEEVHAVTRMALKGFKFHRRPLELLSAYSAAEALQVFDGRSDIALALIDVVMESEHAGLELVRELREGRGNRLTRLVLRTGQAGQAPEDRVIREYEIDDYKEKTELTTQKLRTLLYSMLRSYRDLCLIDAQRSGLSKVLSAVPKVQSASTLNVFASTVLEQLTSLLYLGDSAVYCVVLPGEGATDHETRTLAATGRFVQYSVGEPFESLPVDVVERFRIVIEARASMHFKDAFVLFMAGAHGSMNLLYVTHVEPLSDLDKQLLEIFTHNVAITFQNISLIEDLQATSRDLVYLLAGAVEARSKETGAHVQRVALISEKLAEYYGLSPLETLLIKLASPLHDVGKVAIPDAILNKPGKLDPDEWEVMKKHVEYGVEILQKSRRSVIRKGAEIAGNHHERWDGQGYPQGLSGEAIPISGRITALADVLDALGSRRCYKEPWPSEKIIDLIRSERGKHFDPVLVDILVDHAEEFLAIRERYPDGTPSLA